MKIERISENQIKCTLEFEDLATRGIAMSELAYGTEKAKNLFQEMMQQAFSELGFDTDDVPIMVEAIPTASGRLILLITKVDEADDLDTRFSKFTPEPFSGVPFTVEDDEFHAFDLEAVAENAMENEENSEETDSFVPLPDMIRGKADKKSEDNTQSKKAIAAKITTKVYSFDSLSSISDVAPKANEVFKGNTSIYKDINRGKYFLILERPASNKDSFGEVCNLLSEYAAPLKANYATLSYIKEHYEPIIKEGALSILSAI